MKEDGGHTPGVYLVRKLGLHYVGITLGVVGI
jgi:hypothetical protein